MALIGDESTVSERLHELDRLGVTHLTIPLAGNETERRRGFDLLAALAVPEGNV